MIGMTTREEKQAEVEANYKAFRAILPELMKTHAGKFALLRKGVVVEFLDTPRDALVHGMRTYPDGLFSVQEVTERVIDLGWFSSLPHAAADAHLTGVLS